MVKLQEAEPDHYRLPSLSSAACDSDLLVAAIETHQALLGRAPRLVAADAAFYSLRNEAAAKAKGVKRVCVPNGSSQSRRKREQRKRWSATVRNGAPGLKDASAWSSSTASLDAATRATLG